jgi:glycosidase
MIRRIQLTIWLFAIFQLSFAQLTTNPALPVDSKPVTITFDSSKESRLGFYSGDLYAHTGVIISGNTDWQHVIGSWGNNNTQPKLTNKGNGIYELVISPDIITYYSVPSSELVKQIALVFRSADGSKQTNNLFVDVFTEDLHINITTPSSKSIFEKNQSFQFSASSTSTADLKLFLNDEQVFSQNGTSISQTLSLPEAGNYWLKATATQNNLVKRDSVFVCVRETTTNESRPAGLLSGINYVDDQSATLVIYAPYKNYIFVTGDFTNWLPDNNFQMKKDGDYYWLTLDNLVPQKEYIFQYLIDGNLQIADAYTDKVSDPYDDYKISSTVYPNLIAYPAGNAVDRASVLQTAQTPYQWNTTSYKIPETSKLSIYELLIRDFTAEKTYKAVQERLEYLKRLGINTIELMPFSEFEGNDSWGYNPNFYFAPDKAYGTKNDLKALIDECHKQGFIVIQDMVLNHSYGSSPMVKMYWNTLLNRPAANNPWFNEKSPNTSFSWGYDFNHESQATKDFVDRVTKYWLTEYKVDGFRFDFTKGFTNTPGDGSGYDASRIAILERMADKIWEENPKAFVILEHFAANTEEKELTSYGNGMLVWGNANANNVKSNFSEAAMGYNESGKSDFSSASYQKRGFSKPGLVAYMESHDEERQLFKTITYGNSFGDYNTKNMATALKRSQLTTTFFMSLAGPKMIWQFGELGYDMSIGRCENGSIDEINCRLTPKPTRWDYLDDTERMKLFNVYSAMLRLREMYDVFTSGKETLSVYGALKKIQLTLNDHNITVLGNFGVTDQTITPGFQHTGTWYEFFSGNTLSVSDVNSSILLKPGEYRLYSDVQLPAFKDLATSVSEEVKSSGIKVYPNPATDQITIETTNPIRFIELTTMNGKTVQQIASNSTKLNFKLSQLKPGLYFLKVKTNNQTYVEKIIMK